MKIKFLHQLLALNKERVEETIKIYKTRNGQGSIDRLTEMKNEDSIFRLTIAKIQLIHGKIESHQKNLKQIKEKRKPTKVHQTEESFEKYEKAKKLIAKGKIEKALSALGNEMIEKDTELTQLENVLNLVERDYRIGAHSRVSYREAKIRLCIRLLNELDALIAL